MDTKPPWIKRQLKIDKSVCKQTKKNDASEVKRALGEINIEKHKAKLQIYTDASKSEDGRLTAAFYVPTLKHSVNTRLTNDRSITSAELVAIKLSLEWLKVHYKQEIIEVIIYSDSLSAIQMLESKPRRPTMVVSEIQDIVAMIYS